MSLIKLNEFIHYSDIPLTTMGMQFGSRMTAIKTGSGVILHSPVPIDLELKSKIEQIGDVKYIIAPNKYHYLFLVDAANSFPHAKTVVAPGLEQKLPNFKYDYQLPDCAFSDELIAFFIKGWDTFGETVFYHQKTKSLIVSDFIQEFDQSKPFWTRMYSKIMGFYNKPGLSLPLRLAIRNKKLFKDTLERILELEVETVIPAHGNIIRTGNAGIREAYSWLLD